MQAQSSAATGFSRHTRRFLEWFAVLALVAYALQISALDHWHNDSIPGATDTSAHSAHCHGALSGCSDGGELPGTLAPAALISIPPLFILRDLPSQAASPIDAFLNAPEQPPQAA